MCFCAQWGWFNTCHHFPMHRWRLAHTQTAGIKKRLQLFQTAFCEHYKTMATNTCYLNWFLVRLSRSWLRDRLRAAWLYRTLYEFLLEFHYSQNITCTFMFHNFHFLTDQAKQIHCHCLAKTQWQHWQGRWWRSWCQAKAASLSRLAGIRVRYIFTY